MRVCLETPFASSSLVVGEDSRGCRGCVSALEVAFRSIWIPPNHRLVWSGLWKLQHAGTRISFWAEGDPQGRGPRQGWVQEQQRQGGWTMQHHCNGYQRHQVQDGIGAAASWSWRRRHTATGRSLARPSHPRLRCASRTWWPFQLASATPQERDRALPSGDCVLNREV